MDYDIVSAKDIEQSVTIRAALQLLTPGQKSKTLPEKAMLLPGVRLEKDRIEAFARICGYRPEQGVPITWPYVMAFPLQMSLMLRKGFPYPVVGLVFLANSIKQYEILNAGDTVSVSVRAGTFVVHEKGQAFTLESSLINNGRTVWECTSTYLKRGPERPKGEPVFSLPNEPELSEVSETWDLPANLGREYAKVSGDTNPIHTSTMGARLLGFKRPIAHGMWSKARMLASLLPHEPVSKLSVDVNFKTPAFLPGRVSALHQRQGKYTFFELRDDRNEKPHLRGQLLL